MRTILMINGPVPPEGKEYCIVCNGLYRAQADKFFEKQIKEGLRENTQDPLILDLAEAGLADPQLAEVIGMTLMTQLGLIRACWGHLLPMQLSALPPALQGQMQGVPGLG